MATNSLIFQYPANTIEFIASSAARPKRIYGPDGRATDQLKVDSKGRPLNGFDAVGRLNGQEVQLQVESAHLLPDQVPFGTVWQGSGDPAKVTIRATATGNFATLVVKVELDAFQPLNR